MIRIKSFIQVIAKYPNGTKLLFVWNDELIIKVEIDTMYDTDNGLELDEAGYEEYHVCLVKVIHIKKQSNSKLFKMEENRWIEVSNKNAPSEIQQENGDVIWKIADDEYK